MSGAADSEEGRSDPTEDSQVEIDEPIEPTVAERAAAGLVLLLMVAAMVYSLWIVVRYWNQVAV
ncbi:MAG: hypothetical protein ABEL76_04295 [Bradymonadaceae bacterium]